MNDRDEQIFRRLSEIPVPEHNRFFFEVLRREIVRFDTASARRVRVRWATAVAAALAFSLVLPAILTGRGPLTATPAWAEVQARALAVIAEARTIRGELVTSSERSIPPTTRFSFTLLSDGRYRASAIGYYNEIYIDPSAGVELNCFRTPEGLTGPGGIVPPPTPRPICLDHRGAALGPPDAAAIPHLRNLAAIIRSAPSGGEVSESEFLGRSVWLYRTSETRYVPDLTRGVPGSVECPPCPTVRTETRIAVDEETGFPLQIVRIEEGVTSEEHIENLELDPPVDPAQLEFAFPEGAEITHVDDGFRRMEPSEVRSAAGYTPPLPRRLPEGFEMAQVAVGDEAEVTRPQDMGPEPEPLGGPATNPKEGPVVNVAYRRGLEELILTARPTGPDPSRWTDPFGKPESLLDGRQEVLRDGVLQGERAEIVIDPQGFNHLWIVSEELVITLAGTLDGATLLDIAESLQRVDAP